MYTVNILNKELDKANQRLYVLTEFHKDGVKSFERAFSFAPNASFDDVQFTIKQYVAELEQADSNVEAIPTGEINYAVAPERGNTVKDTWFRNYNTLKQVQELIELGVFTGNEPKIVALRDKVKADFKPEYLNLV